MCAAQGLYGDRLTAELEFPAVRSSGQSIEPAPNRLKEANAMSSADFLAIAIIVVFSGLGVFMGSVRGFAAFIAVMVASGMGSKMIAHGTTPGAFAGTFLGVFCGITIIGFLLYGATKITLLESFEGVFGFCFGLLVGWGLARFVLMLAIYFYPSSSIALGVNAGSMVAYDIFNVTPFQMFMGWTDRIKPKLD
jgi:hypothetical protein